ncbi:MAG TPA: hypothetical protein VM597_21475 [Gemmataceae bacterium]|jgi:hypothetical protein|nr:hypothetical protein [Gemmataceae bacterium]
MSAPASPPKAPPGPLAPPDERFWEKYSPHYEFPLSGVGSVLMNVGALAVFLMALWFMARSTASDKTSLPISAMNVSFADSSDGPPGQGSGGGTPEEAVPTPLPRAPSQPVAEAALKDVSKDVAPWTPNIPNAPDAPKVESLPNLPKLAQLSDEIRKKLLAGQGDKPGAGKEPGTGITETPGGGAGPKGDPSSPHSRSLRWTIDFRTTGAADYRNQLAACKAVVAFPFPDKSLRVFRNLSAATPVSEPFEKEKLPGIYFVDDTNADELARELGLNHRPTYFICFFPAEIENELAAKEREFRGRKESEIFSTTFSIVIRDGRPEIRVTGQEAVRR